MDKKLLVTLGIALLSTAGLLYGAQNQTAHPLVAEYNQWKEIHNKKYGLQEDQHRFQIFQQNYATVLEHQARYEAGEETFTIGMNQFADMTNEEFTAIYLNLRVRPQSGVRPTYYAKGVAVPDQVDWVAEDKIVVKNQGQCGSCWAFSAVAAIEAAHAHNKNAVYLSEQEIVDCATVANGYESEGCNGGWMDDGFRYAIKNKVATEQEYPYKGVDGACKGGSAKDKHVVKEFVDVKPLDSVAFHEAVATTPVSVAINAGGIQFQLYTKGVYSAKCAGGFNDLNHGVLAVGYTSEYYHIKNSWGASWGEKGYIRFALVAKPEGQCGIHQVPSYPIV
ncbi:hypothetical protein pb186bvf_006921 [Paramecium bursaria]